MAGAPVLTLAAPGIHAHDPSRLPGELVGLCGYVGAFGSLQLVTCQGCLERLRRRALAEKFRVQRAGAGWLVTVPAWAVGRAPGGPVVWLERATFDEAIDVLDGYLRRAH